MATTRRGVVACPRRVATALLLGAVLWSAVPVGVSAQEEPDRVPAVRIVVTELDAVLSPPEPVLRARVLVHNVGQTELDGRLVLESGPALRTGEELDPRLADAGPDGTGEQTVAEVDLDALAPGDAAQHVLTVDANAAGWVTRRPVLWPIALAVVRGTRTLDRVPTAAVWLPRAPTPTLPTAVLLPLDGPARPDVDGRLEPAEDLRRGGRLDAVLGAYEQTHDAGVVPVPAPHTVEDLAIRADGFVTQTGEVVAVSDPAALDAAALLARLADAVATGPAPATAPYAGADVGSLALLGRPGLATDALERGRDGVGSLLGRTPSDVLLVRGPLSPALLGLTGAEVVVVPGDESSATRPSVATAVAGTGRRVDVVVADAATTELLADLDVRRGAALAAHRVVLESAVRWSTDPSRPFVVLPPPAWEPDPVVAEQVLLGLTSAPWVRVDDVEALVRSADSGLATLPSPSVDPTLAGLAPALAEATDDVAGASAAVSVEGTRPADALPLDAVLLRLAAPWTTLDAGARRTMTRDVRTAARERLGRVEVADAAGVTLASRAGAIPVTLRRPSGAAVSLLVEVRTPGGLSIDGEPRQPVQLDEGGTATVSFDATALRRGTFPVTVAVWTPDGRIELDRATLSVRASGLSGPALGALAVVVVLLLLRGRRSSRRPRLEVVR